MNGTPKYIAPELLDPKNKFGVSVDVYSLSIMLYEIFSGLDPFPDCDHPMQVSFKS